MKVTLAIMACLLTAGFLTAAEVSGGNDAVVIKKSIVKSSNGYQFICVPVDGLDISGATGGTIYLSTFLPPADLDDGTTVNKYGTSETSTVNSGKWTSDLELKGGDILWVKEPSNANSVLAALGLAAATSEGTGDDDDEIVFCGQDRERSAVGDLTVGGVTALKNDASAAITIANAVTGAQEGDEVLRLVSGSSNYKTYWYDGTNWKAYADNGFGTVTANKVEIAAGEAFYYYRAASAN